MTTFTRLAASTFAALLLSTTLASAGDIFGPISGSDNDDSDTTIGDSIPHSEMPNFNHGHANNVIDPINFNHDGVNAIVMSNQVGAGLKQGHIVLDCSVDTTELLVANAGTVGIPAGTKLKWSIKAYGAQGYLQLKTDLLAGKAVRVSDVLDNAAKAGTPCAVKPTGL